MIASVKESNDNNNNNNDNNNNNNNNEFVMKFPTYAFCMKLDLCPKIIHTKIKILYNKMP